MKTIKLTTYIGKTRDIKVPSKSRPLKVIISRRKWHRGSEFGSSLHASDTHKQCCLGFDARALGFTRCDISGKGTPGDLCKGVPGLSNKDGDATAVCSKMVEVNDNDSTDDAFKEKRLTSLAKRIHRKFVFVP